MIWLELQCPVYLLNWNPESSQKIFSLYYSSNYSEVVCSHARMLWWREFWNQVHVCVSFWTLNVFWSHLRPLLFCVLDFPANNVVKFLVGFTNKGTEDFIVESLDASFRYPQDYQFYIQNFTALPLNTIVPPQRQATFEYSFIPAEPMGGRPFGLVINLNYKDLNVRTYKLCFVFVRNHMGEWPLLNSFLSV